MTQKLAIVSFLVFLTACSTVVGQDIIRFNRLPGSDISRKISPEDYTGARLKLMIGSEAPLTPAFGLSVLYRMGDGVATGILDITKKRGPLNAIEQRNVIDMVRLSFTLPSAIRNPVERRPISSLILLEQLSDTVRDVSLKERLGEAQRFLLDAAGASK